MLKLVVLSALIYAVAAQTCCCYPGFSQCGAECLENTPTSQCGAGLNPTASCTAPSCNPCAKCYPPTGLPLTGIPQEVCEANNWRCGTATSCCCYARGESLEGACVTLDTTVCESSTSSCTRGAALDTRTCRCTSPGATGSLLTSVSNCVAPNFCIDSTNLPGTANTFTTSKVLSAHCNYVFGYLYEVRANIAVTRFPGGGLISVTYQIPDGFQGLVQAGQLFSEQRNPVVYTNLFALAGPFATTTFTPPPTVITYELATDIIQNPQDFHLEILDTNGMNLISTPLSVDYDCPLANHGIFTEWHSRTQGSIQTADGLVTVTANECGQEIVLSGTLFPTVALQDSVFFNPPAFLANYPVFTIPTGASCSFTFTPPIPVDVYALNWAGTYATFTTPVGQFPSYLSGLFLSAFDVHRVVVPAGLPDSGAFRLGTQDISQVTISSLGTKKRGSNPASAVIFSQHVVSTPFITNAPTPVPPTPVPPTPAPGAPTAAPTTVPTAAPTPIPTTAQTIIDYQLRASSVCSNVPQSADAAFIDITARFEKNAAAGTSTVRGGYTASPSGTGARIKFIDLFKYSGGSAVRASDALQATLDIATYTADTAGLASQPGSLIAFTPQLPASTFDAVLANPERYYFSVELTNGDILVTSSLNGQIC